MTGELGEEDLVIAVGVLVDLVRRLLGHRAESNHEATG
jgi:hypothetical protein